MTARETYLLIQELKKVFDIVRLVDAEKTEVCRVDSTGCMTREPLNCYEVWKRDQRCINCVSARVCPQHERIEKYEFIDTEAYHITSKYLVVEGQPFALEIVSHMEDDALLEAYGKDSFIQTITSMTRKMYLDFMTDTYNRRYYTEQVQNWKKVAMAVVDVDDFKKVNDTYGHSIGDEALKAVARVLKAQVRKSDAVVRFGGDEFVLAFTDIPREAFVERLESIRAKVESQRLDCCPALRLTVSIGGAYGEQSDQTMFELADKRLYQAKVGKNQICID